MAGALPYEKELDRLAATLKAETKVLVTTHIKPEGDALGSLIALHRSLAQLGADSSMYMAETSGVAPEYRFLKALDEVHYGKPPEDSGSRTLCAVDCGNAERVGNDSLVAAAPRIINIDHHSDNTRFGAVNLVAPSASAAAEIIYFLIGKLGGDITAEIAEALYTGILVDSGRFQYSSATPATFRAAASLIEHGADHTQIFRNIYETIPLAKVKLLSRLFANMTMACDGRLAAGVLSRGDFEAAGAEGGLTEGLVDNLRAIKGVEVAALVYARPSEPGGGEYKVSLRSSTDRINVQEIAKTRGGGGHPQAAGFSTGEEPEEIIRYITSEVERALRRRDE